MTQKYKAILFDLDGTLVDSAKLIFGAFNHVAEYYLGRKYRPEEITKFFGPSEKSTWVELLPPDQVQEAIDRYLLFYREQQDQCSMFDGIRPLLERLKDNQVPLAICTGRGRTTTSITVEHLGLDRYFSQVLTSTDIERPKPDPEMLLLACQRLDVESSETLMVGDSSMDIEAGRAAGADTAAVLWGTFDLGGPLEAASPDFRFTHPKELEAFLFNGLK